MKLIITVDVEEEGLFSGRYPRKRAGIRNVRELRRLDFVSREFGAPLTLLATYPVAMDSTCASELMRWRDAHGAELGAHPHLWNTPPFQDPPGIEPVPSDRLPPDLLKAKMETLMAALHRRFGAPPHSLRMGRFDLGQQVQALLPACGIRVDSSVVPLRVVTGYSDHFLASPDPYALDRPGLTSPSVREAPLTITPFNRALARWVHRLARELPERAGGVLLNAFRHVAAAGIHPAWFSLPVMKTAVRLHRSRAGQALTLFLHSSELMPGATPHFATESAVNGLVQRLRAFLVWLHETGPIESCTLSTLAEPD